MDTQIMVWKIIIALMSITLVGLIPPYILFANGLISEVTFLVLGLSLSLVIFGLIKLYADRAFRKDQERICREWKERKSRGR